MLIYVYTCTQGQESSVDREEVIASGDAMPQWLERPGASEAVVVGADIRSRYGALLAEVQTKADQIVYN